MILKHRDRELLRFDWLKPFGVRNLELNQSEIRFLPLEFRELAHKGVSRELVWKVEDWLQRRTAPINRRFVRDMMMTMGFNPRDPGYMRQLLEFCHGLSLNDVHWLVPDDFNGKWRNCNLYTNDFSESLAALAFSGNGHRPAADASTSPEYTTDGVLAKCWRRTANGIFLYKAGSENNQYREPYGEVYAAQVASALKMDYVPYALAQYKNRVCSVCPLFTDENHGFIPAGRLLTREEIAVDPRFADIFLLDAILLNDDRHLGNFGFLVDNRKNEICGVAPIFDNGHSFFSRSAEKFRSIRPALYEDWLKFPGLDPANAARKLEQLSGFQLHRDRRFNLPKEEFKSAADFLRLRIDELQKFCMTHSGGGPVKVAFTGPDQLLKVISRHPGLRKIALSKLTGLTERTIKRYLARLGPKVTFRGAPKTGGYFVKKF